MKKFALGILFLLGAFSALADVTNNLEVHWTFEDNFQYIGPLPLGSTFPATNIIADTSTNVIKNNGIQEGRPGFPTNWPTKIDSTTVPGTYTNGGSAGHFQWWYDTWGIYGKSGSYAAITNNMNVLSNLNQASICFWARYENATNVLAGDTWQSDQNATIVSAGSASGVLGSWEIGRNYTPDTVFTVVDAPFGHETTRSFPDNASAHNGDTLAWHHYAVTWTNGLATLYYDGSLVSSYQYTNTTTNLHVGMFPSAANQPWIGVGVSTHSGTPPMEHPEAGGTDYPNHAWFQGSLDELRIYSRAITAQEVSNIFAGPIVPVFYVDVGATNGSNTGASWANAWTNFNAISWSSVSPGSIIWVSGGFYNSNLRIGKSGTPTAPITVKKSQEPGHNGDIWMTNADIGASGFAYWVVDGAISDGIVLTNTFDVKTVVPTNCGWHSPEWTAGTPGAHSGTVRWVDFGNNTNTSNNGMLWSASSYTNIVVEYCYVHDTFEHGIECNGNSNGQQWDSLVVQWCYEYHTGDDFFEWNPGCTAHNCYLNREAHLSGHPDGITGPMGHSRIYNNIFVDVWDNIVYMTMFPASYLHASDVQVYGNLAYVNLGADPPKIDGIQTAASFGWDQPDGTPPPATNYWGGMVYANNTIIGNGVVGNGQIQQGISFVNRFSQSSHNALGTNVTQTTNVVIANNIWFKMAAGGAISLAGYVTDGFAYSPSDVVFSNNVVYGVSANSKSIDYDGTNYATAEALNTAQGFTGNTSSQPTFADPANFNYMLAIGDSAAAKKGADLTTLALPGWGTDLTGNPRVVATKVNIGALGQSISQTAGTPAANVSGNVTIQGTVSLIAQ